MPNFSGLYREQATKTATQNNQPGTAAEIPTSRTGLAKDWGPFCAVLPECELSDCPDRGSRPACFHPRSDATPHK